MKQTINGAVSDALDCLMGLGPHHNDTAEASVRLAEVQQRHPEVELDLVWQREGLTGALNYSALLHIPGEGTLTVEYCPDRVVPWLLRHSYHVRERDFVRVNNETVEIQALAVYLDFIWDEARILDRVVADALIQAEVKKRGYRLSVGERRDAVSAFRRKQGLFTAAETERWLEEHGMTLSQLERFLAGEIVTERLRDELTQGRVGEYFAERHTEFDVARIARFRVPDEEMASALWRRIGSGKLDFYVAAEEHAFAAEGRGAGRLFSEISRRNLGPAQATAIFSAAAGQVVRPVAAGSGYDLVKVLQVRPATLDERTREAVKEALFAQWVAERRASASVEWYWGDQRRTP